MARTGVDEGRHLREREVGVAESESQRLGRVDGSPAADRHEKVRGRGSEKFPHTVDLGDPVGRVGRDFDCRHRVRLREFLDEPAVALEPGDRRVDEEERASAPQAAQLLERPGAPRDARRKEVPAHAPTSYASRPLGAGSFTAAWTCAGEREGDPVDAPPFGVLGREGDQQLPFGVLELHRGDPSAVPADDVGVRRLTETDR